MQFARISQTSIFKREFNASGWRTAAVIPSSQEWRCADAHHPRINGTLSCVCQYPAFPAGAGRNRNRDAGNFSVGAGALIPCGRRARSLLRSNKVTRWGSNPDMKQLFGLLVIISLDHILLLPKQLTEAEIQALIEREVKRQVAAEHEAEERELERRRAEFNARKNALLGRKAAQGSASAPGCRRARSVPQLGIDRQIRRQFIAGAPPSPAPSPRVTLPERAPGSTFPARPSAPGRFASPVPAASVPATSETLATPSVTPDLSASPSFSPLPEAAEGASPTPTPAAPDGTAQ